VIIITILARVFVCVVFFVSKVLLTLLIKYYKIVYISNVQSIYVYRVDQRNWKI